jgi:mannose-6-phosphate isomerase-like protein (cupin superfamily)
MATQFNLSQLAETQAQGAKRYLEFLRVPAMSAGLYVLPAGEPDPQQPHTEDELYYVAAGRGHIRVGNEEIAVGPGALVYVPAGVPHRFFDIAEALQVLVFFAPAEYSNKV